MIEGFSHIYLPVRDVDESIDFYTKHFGFYLHRKYSTNGNVSAYVGLNGVLLELTHSGNTPAADGRNELRIGLVVDNLDATLESLKSAGVELRREPFQAATFWGRQAVVVDPSGYGISLREYRAPDSATFKDWEPEKEGVVRLA